MSKLFAASIAAAVLAIASPLTAQTAPKFPTDSYMAKIISRGTLNVGTKFELLGVGFQNPMTGKVEGFAVDLAADLAERMFGASGKATYRPTLPVNRITMLQQGLIDLDIETMFITKERWGQVDFSEPYWSAPTVIFVHKSNKTVTKLTDLVGKTVASTKGSSSERAFHDPNSGYPKAELVMFELHCTVDRSDPGRPRGIGRVRRSIRARRDEGHARFQDRRRAGSLRLLRHRNRQGTSRVRRVHQPVAARDQDQR